MQFERNRVSLQAMAAALVLLFSTQALAISDEARRQGIPTLAPMLQEVTPAVVSIRVAKSVPTAAVRRSGHPR